MKQADFDALERRISDRAERMWQDAGSPDGDLDSYRDEARELIAIEEVPVPGFDPFESRSIVEEASLQRNLGEFPTLVDQGDEQTFPDTGDDDGEIRLSDGDASEQGGVLPSEDLPATDLPDVPEYDRDITSDAPEDDADLDPDDLGPVDVDGSDLNDDGLPDLPPLRR